MSAATNAFGSSSGSEGPVGDVLGGSSSLQLSSGRPSAFVCQRCLRLLDMYPLYSELSNVDLDLGFDCDLIKVLERGEPLKHSQAFNVPFDINGRSPSMSLGDSKVPSPLANYSMSGSATVSARSSSGSPIQAGRKKRNEPGISKTFSSLTNFFKSSTTTSTPAVPQTPQPATSASPSPSSPKLAPIMAVPLRPSVEGSISPSMNIPEESRSMRDEDDNDDDPMSSSRATSVTSSYVGTRSPQSVNDTAHSLHTASGDEGLQDDDGWAPSITPPAISASVSRAAMREKSFGPSLMPTARRSKRIHGNNPSSDYVSRRNPTRDGIPLAGSASILNVSSSISAPQSLNRASLRKTSMLISQAMLETSIDFPLCQECSNDVLNELDDEEYDLSVQIEDYEAQLNWLGHEYFTTMDFSEEMAVMEQQLRECTEDIEKSKTDITELGDEAEVWRTRGTELLMAKSEYWRSFEFHAADREAMLENTISAHNRLTHAKNWLEIMRTSHVLHDSFPISSDLHLATISNLRLGRLPSQPTDWPEISAALGLMVHLLQELCTRADFTLPKYCLILEGSFSGLKKLVNPASLPTSSSNPRSTEQLSGSTDSLTRSSAPASTAGPAVSGSMLPLHADGDISIVRLMHFKSLNDGVAALAECIQELSLHLSRLHPGYSLPFPIVKDLVAGVSVKRAWNSSGATWSGAMRALLANLKHTLAFMSQKGLCV